MYYQDLILDALEIVSAWDIPVEDFAQVVNDQAKLMSGMPIVLRLHFPILRAVINHEPVPSPRQ